jgi:hypothetical protein
MANKIISPRTRLGLGREMGRVLTSSGFNASSKIVNPTTPDRMDFIKDHIGAISRLT